ncbi:MAG TPA: hypothetical protein VNA24_27905 [Hyalangium sp.]|nr:hypothetical protein [Hyalangium sp.]
MLHHAPDDAVCPPSVLMDNGRVLLEIPDGVLNLSQRGLGFLLQCALQFLGELDAGLGKVVDEVERVPELVRDARSEVGQGRQLF